ncbi:MAG TPA: hypothetical protein VHO70_19830 [Chitinispirillaceae bacterium]|nr:hypothetical protein [Chitinispirillaceae bacterium]
MIKIINDAYELLFEVVKKMYGNINAEVQFAPIEGEEAGCTSFPDDGGVPLITVNACIPFIATIEIIAHEIAHIIAGVENEHNEKWEKVFSDIHEQYYQAIQEDAEKNNLKVETVDVYTKEVCKKNSPSKD